VAVVGREASSAITIQDGIPWVYEGMRNGDAIILNGPGCGDVTIPSELDCYPVRGIGSSAFANCTRLTSVTLPNSVTFISDEAFANCIGLTSMTLPESVGEIGNGAFSGCTNLKTLCLPLSMAGTSYVGNSGVPDTCAVLYGEAWEEVEGVAWSYVVEDGKTTVTAGPRQGDVTIPSVLGGQPVTGIGSNAFHNCYRLVSVTIPDRVTNIGDRAFYGCDGLTSVTMPDSVTSIGDFAFYDCGGLTAVTIGISVTDIGDYAFYSCRSLTSVTIPDRVANIGGWAFGACTNLTAATIGNGVTDIGEYAFHGCNHLTATTIGNSVTNIGDGAFYGCDALTSVTIPDGVTSIGDSAFTGCSGLKTVDIGNGVRSIGSSGFYHCSNLTAVTIHDLKAWCEIDFASWDSNPLCYAKHLYLDGEEVAGDLVIPDGTKTIGRYAFHWCTNLNLTSVTIPDSVRNIGYGAFSRCGGLTSVTIGDGVTSIESNAFEMCDGLTAVNIHDVKAWCEIDFASWDSNPLRYAKHLYLDGEEVAGALVIPPGTKSIGNCAFYACSQLTSLTIPPSVTRIGAAAFEYCSGLESVTIPDGVTRIGAAAFEWCSGLTSVTMPNSVTDIGDWVFSGCDELKTLYVPASWEGTDMLANAGVPGGCTVMYGTSPEPSAEIRYAAWLESLGETAAELPMGGDSDGDGMSNWEECVAGTNPLDAEDRFEARIRKVDGKIVVDSSAENTGRVYRVHGTTVLVGGEGGAPVWNDVTDEEDLSRTDCRYFKMEARFAD